MTQRPVDTGKNVRNLFLKKGLFKSLTNVQVSQSLLVKKSPTTVLQSALYSQSMHY